MEWWHSIILGIVEGVTEYLPISSTGHLLLFQRILGIPQSAIADAFAICIQAGAIVAVLGLYHKRVQQMVLGLAGRDTAGLRLAMNIVAGFLPAVVLGLLLEKPIKKYLFGGDIWGLWPIVLAWFAGGVAILAVSWYRRWRRAHVGAGIDLDALTWRMAFLIGISQCVAMWPGTSRSLVTIVAGIVVGLRVVSAVEFSFLLGVVTLSAATFYDALQHGADMLSSYGAFTLFLGFLAAWMSAVAAIKWMLSYLTRHGLSIFGYYRVALAAGVAAAILLGHLNARQP
jgi:undecaprenyl-diphosphatase